MTLLEWSALTPEQRDELVAKYMPPSDVNPIKDVWLTFDGKLWRRTLCKTEEEAHEMLAHAKKGRAIWDKIFGDEMPWILREKVSAVIRAAHLRYSETPAGAWDALEHLLSLGCGVAVLLNGSLCTVTITGFKFEAAKPRSAEVSYQLPFSQVACIAFIAAMRPMAEGGAL